MSGYSYPGGWLHNELRGAGLVYYVHAFQMTGPVPGYFAVIAQTRPDKVGEVVARIETERATGQSRDASARRSSSVAVKRVIALHAQENTTISQQAQQAAIDELYGLGYDYARRLTRESRRLNWKTWSRPRGGISETTCWSPRRPRTTRVRPLGCVLCEAASGFSALCCPTSSANIPWREAPTGSSNPASPPSFRWGTRS